MVSHEGVASPLLAAARRLVGALPLAGQGDLMLCLRPENIGAEGALPLSVIVGNASGTEVRVRGELLEVAKTTRDNVARFEVK